MSIPQAQVPGGAALPKRGFGTKSWHVNLVWGTIVAVVVIVTAAFGGFKQVPMNAVTLNAGTAVSLGLGEVRITGATATESSILPGDWTITVQAQVQPAGQPVDATAFGDALRVRYVNGSGVTKAATVRSMTVMDPDDPSLPTPRLSVIATGRYVPVEFQIDAPDGVTPGKGLTVGLFPVVYTEHNDPTGQYEGSQWQEDDSLHQYWVLTLPLQA